MADGGTSRLDQIPGDIPSELGAGLSSMATMIADAAAAAVVAQAEGGDPYEAARQAVTDGAS